MSIVERRRISKPLRDHKADLLDILLAHRPTKPPSQLRYLTQLLKTSAPLAAGDLISLLLSTVLVASAFRALSIPIGLDTAILCIFLSTVLLIVYSLLELYPATGLNPISELRQTSVGTVVVFLGFISKTVVDGANFDTLLLCAACAMSILLIPLTRSAARRSFSRFEFWGQPVLIFGENGEGRANYQYLKRNPRLGFRPIGIVGQPDKHSNGNKDRHEGYLGPLERAESITVKHSVFWAVVAMSERSPTEIRDVIERHACTIPHVLVVPELKELPSLWKRGRDCAGVPAIRVQTTLLLPIPRLLKRLLDVTVVFAGGLLSLPLVILIALMIRMNSPGPVFYAHERITRGGRRFRAWKFRTMIVNADQALQQYLDEDAELRAEWERDEKLKNDPRVTKIGGWLRRTSLDELPQIWNVLVGDMSLVGPRPIVTGEAARYQESIGLYLKVLPGITGLWQISGRNDTTFDERLDLDSYYIRNWSLWMDLYILARTVRVVITGEGAY